MEATNRSSASVATIIHTARASRSQRPRRLVVDGVRCRLSHRLLDPAPLSVLSQPHSTALPSPSRYDKRYEEKFQEEGLCPHQLPTRTWWWARGWGGWGHRLSH